MIFHNLKQAVKRRHYLPIGVEASRFAGHAKRQHFLKKTGWWLRRYTPRYLCQAKEALSVWIAQPDT
jgi:hypothetical protein